MSEVCDRIALRVLERDRNKDKGGDEKTEKEKKQETGKDGEGDEVEVEVEVEDYLLEAARQSGGLLVGARKATRAQPFAATVKAKRLLTTSPPADQNDDKWHIVLDVSHDGGAELLEYLPGDALGVIPENDPAELQRIAKAFGHGVDVETVRRALGDKNIKDVPRALLDLFGTHGRTPAQDSEYLRDRWLADVLFDKLNGHAVTVADVASVLRTLQPRYFSIASAPSMDEGEIHLCVAAVRYETLGLPRKGVASTYLIDRAAVGPPCVCLCSTIPTFGRPRTRARTRY